MGCFPIYGKTDNAPNHDLVMTCYTVFSKLSNRKNLQGWKVAYGTTTSLVEPDVEFPVNARITDSLGSV